MVLAQDIGRIDVGNVSAHNSKANLRQEVMGAIVEGVDVNAMVGFVRQERQTMVRLNIVCQQLPPLQCAWQEHSWMRKLGIALTKHCLLAVLVCQIVQVINPTDAGSACVHRQLGNMAQAGMEIIAADVAVMEMVVFVRRVRPILVCRMIASQPLQQRLSAWLVQS